MAEEMIYIPETFFYWEVRADREWLYVKKGNRSAKIPMSSLEHCIVSVDTDYVFRLITKDRKALEFSIKKRGDNARKLFFLLNSFCTGFRNTVSTYNTYAWTSGIFHYRLDRNELAVDYLTKFRKVLKPFCRIPVQDIVWVTQHHSTHDTESPECYYLRVYTANGKYEDIEGDNIQHCYEIALMIKDLAPRVRYSIFSFTGFSGLTDGMN